MLTLPNLITILRLALVPVFGCLAVGGRFEAALLVFLVAGISDALDGYLARRLNQVSRLGAILDPIADKLLILTGVAILAAENLIPLWLAVAVAARDAIIVSGALTYRRLAGSIEMTPTLFSKINSFFAFTLAPAVLSDAADLISIRPWLPLLFYILLGTTLVSGAHYVWVWARKAASIRPGRRA